MATSTGNGDDRSGDDRSGDDRSGDDRRGHEDGQVRRSRSSSARLGRAGVGRDGDAAPTTAQLSGDGDRQDGDVALATAPASGDGARSTEERLLERAVHELESAAEELGSLAEQVERAETERRRSVELLDAVLRLQPLPLVVLDADRRILAWSDRALELWPGVADEGRRLRSLVDEFGASSLRHVVDAWAAVDDGLTAGRLHDLRWEAVGAVDGDRLLVVAVESAATAEGSPAMQPTDR